MIGAMASRGYHVDGIIDASRGGSVLMEFIIVAPLYFILLGGLFILSDLMTNMIRVHMGDHFVTWVGGSRHCPTDKDGNKDAQKVQAILKPLYDLSIGGSIDDVGFKVDYSNDKDTDFNHFMMFYMGRVKRLPIKMPNWARGMFGMEDTMRGNGNLAEFSEITYKSDDYFRSYTFHRLPLSGLDQGGGSVRDDLYSRSRKISGGKLINQLTYVYEDRWANDDSAGDTTGNPSSSVMDDVPRFLGYFAE